MVARNLFSQVTPQSFNNEDVNAIKNVINYLHKSADTKLTYPPL